jgi:hypothetical protein
MGENGELHIQPAPQANTFSEHSISAAFKYRTAMIQYEVYRNDGRRGSVILMRRSVRLYVN